MTDDRWEQFLNPDVVRTKFVSLGLYMVAHEMLLSVVKDHPHSFFADTWTAEDGWLTSEAYRREVLALDPKGKNDAFRGSVAWFRKMNAITEQDEEQIRTFTDVRNAIAHEMRNIIAGGEMPNLDDLFPRLVDLIGKIGRWWVINVEIATDPDMAGKDIEEDGVMPGSLMVLQILSRVALGNEDEAWELYREFAEQTAAQR